MNQAQLFKMLLHLIQDNYQEARIYARKAILALEHGENALQTRLDVQALLSQSIKSDFDMRKFFEVLEKGPYDDGLKPF
jgi:hypothetical protein